jgi:ribose 1,5-bisphosphokinase PhnN
MMDARSKWTRLAKPGRHVIGRINSRVQRNRHVFDQPSHVSSFNCSYPYTKMGRKHTASLALLLPVLANTANAASESSRPRGVGPECMLHPPELR